MVDAPRILGAEDETAIRETVATIFAEETQRIFRPRRQRSGRLAVWCTQRSRALSSSAPPRRSPGPSNWYEFLAAVARAVQAA